MKLFSQFTHLVNEATGSRPLRWFINEKIRRYGTVTHFKIDNKTRTIEAEVMLKGELEPITITLAGYALERTHAGHALRFAEIKVSRIWMEALARDFLQKPLPLPAEAAKWLALVL